MALRPRESEDEFDYRRKTEKKIVISSISAKLDRILIEPVDAKNSLKSEVYFFYKNQQSGSYQSDHNKTFPKKKFGFIFGLYIPVNSG